MEKNWKKKKRERKVEKPMLKRGKKDEDGKGG